jgi:DNA-binding response OmpR family regulator
MRILLVEDEEPLGRSVALSLTKSGCTVDWIRSGREADASVRDHEYEVILLDLGLLDMTGDTLLQRWRAAGIATPVIVLTARGLVEDRVSMLDLGADDYMVKPYDVSELLARMRALKRRSAGGADATDVQRVGPLELAQASRSVRWKGQTVALTAKEYDLLEALVMRRPRVLSRSQIEESLYGWGDEVESNSIEVYVHFLRRKISPHLIVTVRGKGYQLGSEEMLESDLPATARSVSRT